MAIIEAKKIFLEGESPTLRSQSDFKTLATIIVNINSSKKKDETENFKLIYESQFKHFIKWGKICIKFGSFNFKFGNFELQLQEATKFFSYF